MGGKERVGGYATVGEGELRALAIREQKGNRQLVLKKVGESATRWKW